MKSVTSISGGKTSAYLAANYPTDYNIFALVTTSDKNCIYPDKKLRQVVSDKIGKEFIGTLEDDIIIHTILDLEQFMGRRIDWVCGDTFEQIIQKSNKKGDYLPNIMKRYCTTQMKIDPIFNFWRDNINEPILMNIGYRSTEKKRADRMLEKVNKNGLSEYKTIIGKHPSGLNKWAEIEWRKPNFPLVDDFIERQDIEKFWKNKPVRFAELNNCVGCFHRSASLLNKMSKLHPNKFDWFIKQEKKTNNRFKSDLSYQKIKDSNFTMNIPFDYDAEGCGSGFCGI
jgi:hypothetical protein